MTNQDDNITLLSPCMFPGVENTNREQVSSATWGQVVPRYNGDTAFDKRMDINVPRTWTNSISFASGNSSLTSSRGEWRTPEEGVIDSENVWSDSFLMDDDRSSSWSDSPPSKRSVKVRSGRSKKSRVNSVSYKHIPHREKPPQLVARRNARERRRVQAVNTAFSRLRKVVPIDNNRGKRVSKVKTLHKAIEYINQLQDLLMRTNDTNNLVCRSAANHQDSLADFLDDFEDDF